jgi:hypothetical protein
MTLPIHNPEIKVCRRLRTKQAFMHSGTDAPWQNGTSITAAYWCLRTMGAAGPDEAFVHPRDCREGRSCYEINQ